MRCLCGGKLTVIDTAQTNMINEVLVRRVRECNVCGHQIVSIEKVKGAMTDAGYKHYQRGGKIAN